MGGFSDGTLVASLMINTNYADVVLSISELIHQKGNSIRHLNCTSLFPKDEELSVLLSQSELELVYLSETGLNSNTSTSIINISGYNFERKDGRNL